MVIKAGECPRQRSPCPLPFFACDPMAKTVFSAALGAAVALPLISLVGAAKVNSTIEWTSCSDWNPAFGNYSESFRCGYFDVPLDWADESVGTAHIAVVKYPASDKEKKGSIFFNPGMSGCSAGLSSF